MFYKISFSEELVRRRRRWSLIRQSVAVALVALAYLLFADTYVGKSMTIYALTREYSSIYLELLPRDIALSAAMPVVAEFQWVGRSRNKSHIQFLDALAADLTLLDLAASGGLTYSSDRSALTLDGGLASVVFTNVNAFLASAERGGLDDDRTPPLSAAEFKEDLLASAYLDSAKDTPLAESEKEQVNFISKQMKGFNTELFNSKNASLEDEFENLVGKHGGFFQIDPQMTLALLGEESSLKEDEWRRISEKRFPLFKRRLNQELDERVSFLRDLDVVTPLQQVTQPLFGRADWLLRTSTNFFTQAKVSAGEVERRILEVAGWAGFYRNPVVSLSEKPTSGRLFSLIAFRVQSPEGLSVSFSQYVDFYKCLVGEQERFRVLNVPQMKIEVRDGAAFVTQFELEGEIAVVDPEVLRELRKRMDDAEKSSYDLKKALKTKGLTVDAGRSRRGR